MSAERPEAPKTTVQPDPVRNILSRNDSPDIPFEYSINPYRGCEHGCIYCYARPSHAWLDLSPGIDFETKLFARVNAAEALRAALSKPSYRCTGAIALGSNTDPWQPAERTWNITRDILRVLDEFCHPCVIVTKSWMVERELERLAGMAQRRLVRVFLSITTLDSGLAQAMEPRATAPQRRLQTLRNLRDAGIETGVMFAPVIPALNDHEMEAVLHSAAEAGAQHAGHVLLRLPLEVRPLFEDWLQSHYPDRKEHVLSLIRQSRDGKLNESGFHHRFRGHGAYAQMLSQRFRKARRKHGFLDDREPLDTSQFQVPGAHRQLNFFSG